MEDNFPCLIIGLGNPGAGYRHNRHNIGFMLVDRVAERLGVKFSRLESKALLTKGEHHGRRVVLAKPQTFMNLSGQAVGRLSRAHHIPPERILVVYDDLDLPLGRLRLRREGSSGGHKGMRSIIESLGTQAFPRLRVGIDRPLSGGDPVDYVLQPFAKDEQALVAETVARAVAAVECWLWEGIAAAMDRFNRPTPGSESADLEGGK